MLNKYDTAVSMFLQNCELNEYTDDTIANYSRITRLYREFLIEKGYEEATMASTFAWKVSLTDRSPLTVDLYIRVLILVSDFAKAMHVLKDDERFADESLLPQKKTIRKERNKEYEHKLSAQDAQILMNAERANFGKTSKQFFRDKAIVAVSICSGLRNMELRSLTLNDLDWESGTIYVKNGKGGKSRYVPFLPQAQKAVKQYLASGTRPCNLPEDAVLFGRVSRMGVWTELERTYLSSRVYEYVRLVLGEEKAVFSHALSIPHWHLQSR